MDDDDRNASVELLKPDEVALIPIDPDKGLVLALGYDLKEDGEPVARGLLDAALDKAGFLGGAYASKAMLDGSLVRLAPQTVKQIREGAVFLKDKEGLALGTLKEAGGHRFAGAVRFVPEAANPVAGALMLQTMAIQRQLGQIQDALEAIDAKLDTLLKGHHHGVLGSVLNLAVPLDELARKLRGGHQLTETDEVKLRDYEDEARGRQIEATLWLASLRDLLRTEDLTLKQQHDILDSLVQKEHVGFWLRIYIASRVTLARARWMRLSRAAAVEAPEWAQELQRDVTDQLDASAQEIVALAAELDAYLRNHDIASGFEELSLGRKRRVRQLRRQLREVHEELREGLATSETILRGMLQDAESFAIPERLSRRDFEPWLVRDNVYDASQRGLEASRDLASNASQSAIRSASRFLQRAEARLEERRQDAESDASEEE